MDIKLIEKKSLDTNKVAEFVSCVLAMATITHKQHLKITGIGSFAIHSALNDLYNDLPEHGDKIAELYQGYYGKLITSYPNMPEEKFLMMKPLEVVTWFLKYIEDYRSVFKDNTMLQNQVDELCATVAKAKYKLTFLQ